MIELIYNFESWSEFKAVREKLRSCKYVETQSGTRHGYNETPHISKVSNGLCPNK